MTLYRTKRARLAVLFVSILTAMGLSFVLGGGSPASGDPPGNNGVVKVDGEEFDDAPNNEPHVGCTFQVDFYGFDAGDLFANVTFEAHPPTGSDTVVLTDTVFIGEDDNKGGGSESGLDASK